MIVRETHKERTRTVGKKKSKKSAVDEYMDIYLMIPSSSDF